VSLDDCREIVEDEIERRGNLRKEKLCKTAIRGLNQKALVPKRATGLTCDIAEVLPASFVAKWAKFTIESPFLRSRVIYLS
jgi:hypothetical protein